MKKLNSVCIINCDNTITCEKNIVKLANKIIDLTSISGLRLMSSIEKMKQLSKKLSSTINYVNFLGSGDYHHLTYSIISNIKQKFNLIVFDNHCDYHDMPLGTISCGSWINYALKLDNVESILILGASNIDYNIKNNKIFCVKYDSNFVKNSIEMIKKVKIPNVYISIDKDVLDKKYAITNWDQGYMRLEEMIKILEFLKSKFNIIGIDISGEYKSTTPFPYLFSNELKINEDTNLKILNTLIN